MGLSKKKDFIELENIDRADRKIKGIDPTRRMVVLV